MGCCCSKCALPCRRRRAPGPVPVPPRATFSGASSLSWRSELRVSPSRGRSPYEATYDGWSPSPGLAPELVPRPRLLPSPDPFPDLRPRHQATGYGWSPLPVLASRGRPPSPDYDVSSDDDELYEGDFGGDVYFGGRDPLSRLSRRPGAIGSQGGWIEEDDIHLFIPPDSLREVKDIHISLEESSRYLTMIQNSGLDDILSCFRLIECKPDHLQFQTPVDVRVFFTSVPQSDNFLLFGQETSTVAEVTWKDLSDECSLRRSASDVLFKLQHFSIYILVAVISSVALSSASKLLLDCLNGKSFPCSFTPYLGKISGKKHPLTIVCKEGRNASTATPRMYQRFGLARTSEFNIFDEERLSVEIRHLALVKRCADTYQVNRATCKTEEGQAMDLIVEPEKDENLLTGQAVISVSRFLGASVRKICTLNLASQSARPEHHETGEIVPVSVAELGATSGLNLVWSEAPTDHPSMKGVRKYFYFIKEKVGWKWTDLAFFLDLDQFDVATIENICGRNRDDKSRCMDMLNHWQKRRGVDATIDVLLECLSKAGLQDVVDGLKIEFPEVAETEEAKRTINIDSQSKSEDE